jgi:site-specific recombinase XerD
MASLSRDNSDNVTLQFVHPHDGKRRSIRLGKLSKRNAAAIKGKVEKLVEALASGLPLDAETDAWVRQIGADLRDRFAAVGLVQRLAAARLGEFLDQYIQGRTDVKASTRTNLGIGRDRLLKYFEADRALHDITPGDADAFLLHLRREHAQATAGKTLKWAKQFFKAAVRSRLIRENPFQGIKAPGMTNKERLVFITRETTQKVIEACPDHEWRLIIALARFGGVRTPSETFALEWSGLDWERSRFLVHAPKTEHLEGKESRLVPIFPELRPYLEEAFDRAEEGAVHLIARHRLTSGNLRTQMHRIIRRAGLVPWVKPFQNMRSSRETELAAEYPLHVVTGWLGNTPAVAMQSYLQMTEDYFQRAANSGAVALQIPVQHGSAPSRMESQESSEALAGCESVRDSAEECDTVQNDNMTPRGFEPLSQP